jgi:hypothetical protein
MERVGIALPALAAASGAEAELVVFTDGRVVKAAGHQTAGAQLEIQLPGGGNYSAPTHVVISPVPPVTPNDAPRPRPSTAWNRRHRAGTAADAQSPGMARSRDGLGRQ